MRLIDADALIKRLKEDWPQTSKISWAQIVAKGAPTIDAEPIIYCKDCKNWKEWENGAGSCQRSGMWLGTDATDFCSFAERREP